MLRESTHIRRGRCGAACGVAAAWAILHHAADLFEYCLQWCRKRPPLVRGQHACGALLCHSTAQALCDATALSNAGLLVLIAEAKKHADMPMLERSCSCAGCWCIRARVVSCMSLYHNFSRTTRWHRSLRDHCAIMAYVLCIGSCILIPCPEAMPNRMGVCVIAFHSFHQFLHQSALTALPVWCTYLRDMLGVH